jgi:hypothetical protein
MHRAWLDRPCGTRRRTVAARRPGQGLLSLLDVPRSAAGSPARLGLQGSSPLPWSRSCRKFARGQCCCGSAPHPAVRHGQKAGRVITATVQQSRVQLAGHHWVAAPRRLHQCQTRHRSLPPDRAYVPPTPPGLRRSQDDQALRVTHVTLVRRVFQGSQREPSGNANGSGRGTSHVHSPTHQSAVQGKTVRSGSRRGL